MELSKRWVPAPHSDGSAVRMEVPVDREVLAGLRGLQGEEETDIVAELAAVFIEDARSGLEEVEEALRKGAAPAVEWVAHKLKGGRQHGCKGDVRPLRAVGRRRRIWRSLAKLPVPQKDQGGAGAGRPRA